jgi:hypothetical protein
VKSVAALDLAQLNIVPDGFNNSIAWNIAHILVTQQLLHYKLSGKDCVYHTSKSSSGSVEVKTKRKH